MSIAWAPDLPPTWRYGSLRWLATIYAGGTPDREKPEYWSGGTVPWLNSGSVNEWVIAHPSEFISDAGFAHSSARWVPAGSVVIGLAGQGKTKGTSARLEIEATTNQSMAAIVPGPELDYRFLHYWLASNYQSIRNLAGGDKRDGLNLQHIAGIECPLPPMDEQQAIADYLDRETAQIDTLIAKQEQLIATLRERRTSVIIDLVSNGTDKTAPMKLSGLGWTTKIPAHWQELNIRRVATMKTGHTPSRSVDEYWDNTTIPWFTLADVWQLRDGTRTYLGETANMISELGLANSAAELLPAGTVVLSRTASVGFSGIMPVPMATSQDYWNWICGPLLLPEYLMRTFRAMRDYLRSLMIGSTHQTIYQPIAAAIHIPLPPIDEQRAIVDRCSAETGQIDTLIAKAEQLIALAGERRAALITAAVTGQIDVSTAA